MNIGTKDNEYKFAKLLLNSICEKENFLANESLDLAIGLSIENKYKDIVNALVHDGYISLISNEYKFNSPLLKMWWSKNV